MLDALKQTVTMLGKRAECYLSPQAFLQEANLAKGMCLVSDLKMPEMSGLQLFEAVRQLNRQLPLILITGFGDVPSAVQAMKLGAITCLEKPFHAADFLSALETAVARKLACSPSEVERERLRTLLEQLSVTERAVFHGIARGQTNSEIAARLDISARTVQFRRSDVKRKLGIRSRADLLGVLNLFALLEAEP